MLAECAERLDIVRHSMIGKIASDNLPQPFPLFGDVVVHTPPQLFFDFLELYPHAIPPGLPSDEEFPFARATTDEWSSSPQGFHLQALAEPYMTCLLYTSPSPRDA